MTEQDAVLTRLINAPRTGKKKMLPKEKRWKWLEKVEDPLRFSTTNKEFFVNPADLVLVEGDSGIIGSDKYDQSTGVEVNVSSVVSMSAVTGSAVGSGVKSAVAMAPEEAEPPQPKPHKNVLVTEPCFRFATRRKPTPKTTKFESLIQALVSERRVQPTIVQQPTVRSQWKPTALNIWRTKHYKAVLQHQLAASPQRGSCPPKPKQAWFQV
eukprot:TRINITY_DN28890_c0_g1_i1.p2 TRINITY_DN28890_c0_g1~~TRINITY_DN28890_c0_g1_i1.p2  ORF type:complete len:211 (+),score=11.48 TRINITY_DN28890_c0_g1_i1:804-1436(+)